MARAKKSLRDYLYTDRRSISVCLTIALIAWFLTKMGKEYTYEQTYPIVYQISPDKTFAQLPTSVLFTELRANGWSFLRMAISGKEDSLHVSALEFTNQNISSRILLSNSLREVINDEIEIYTISPETISFNLVDKAHKLVPIFPEGDLPLAAQYQLRDKVVVVPDSVTIYGPASQLDSINRVYTRPLDIAPLEKDYDNVVQVALTKGELVAEPGQVRLQIPVEQITEKEMAVPISIVDSLQNKVHIFPDEALVKCTVGLSKFEQVSKSDFLLEAIPPENGQKGNYRVMLKKSPDYVSSISYSPQFVEIFLINP